MRIGNRCGTWQVMTSACRPHESEGRIQEHAGSPSCRCRARTAGIEEGKSRWSGGWGARRSSHRNGRAPRAGSRAQNAQLG